MTGARLSEDQLIQRIRARFPKAPPPPAGIGDDAAVLGTGAYRRLLTQDCLIEGRHFSRDEPPWLLGRKALAVNLSDVAAMGGRPTGFLLTLGIPLSLTRAWIEDLLDGMADAARAHAMPVLGGDTSASPATLFLVITILGAMPHGAAPLTRSGARAGDGLYVSGALGASAAGRRLLDKGWVARAGRKRTEAISVRPRSGRAALSVRTRALQAIRAHLDPQPRLGLGQILAREKLASGAMDLSDGLSLDLARFCAASGVGARLWTPAIPIADPARALAESLKTTPLDLALNGGEDYELLFTVPESRQRALDRRGLPALCIGRVERRSFGIQLEDAAGRLTLLRSLGFDHFRTK